jgi:hypothetical protein
MLQGGFTPDLQESEREKNKMTKPAGGQLERSGFLRETDTWDEFVFLRAWMRAPLVTAAMLPSGPFLSRAMAAAVDPATPGPIVELGPGTGAVTGALVDRGIPPERLILIRKGRGTTRHKGGALMQPNDDLDQCIVEWLKGNILVDRCFAASRIGVDTPTP